LIKALSIDVDAFGPEHPDSVRDALRLAALLVNLKRPDDARAISEHIASAVKNAFGDSKTWPLDIERAFGRIVVSEFAETLETLNARRQLQQEVAEEFRRIKSAVARQRMLGLLLYVMAAIFAVTAIASIVQQYFELIPSLQWLIGVYRAAIHGPPMWLNRWAFPGWQIPGLTWDIIVAWLAFWVAANASLLRLEGMSVAGKINAVARDFGISNVKRRFMLVVGPLGLFIVGPPFFIYFTVRHGLPIDPESKGLLIFWAAVICCVVAIVVLNQAVRSLG
jgi:hypothetical protein